MHPSTGQNPVDETTTHSGVVKPSFANFRDDSIHGLGIAEDGRRFDRYGFHVRSDFQSRTLEGT